MGFAYAGSMMKYGFPQHMLAILKAIREKIGKGPGDTVDVVVWKDEEVRTIEIPAAFKALLKKEGLLAGFEKLSYYAPERIRALDCGSKDGRDAAESHGQGRRDVEKGREDAEVTRRFWRRRNLTPQGAFARLRVAACSADPA